MIERELEGKAAEFLKNETLPARNHIEPLGELEASEPVEFRPIVTSKVPAVGQINPPTG